MKNNNKFLSLAVLLLLTSIATASLADTLKLKPGHPQEYTVQKGDTLWDISATFLSKPWFWPEIWQINKQIENPNLIYPGDVLKLVYVNGRPYITRDRYGKRTVKLSPETRIEVLEQAIPTIPLDVIAPYLTKNRILNAGEYGKLPYIIGMNDGHMSAGTNNSIYVMNMPEDEHGTTYGVYGRGNAYRNPDNNNEILGYEAIYLGEGQLTRKGNPATIIINKSKAEILKKHRVIPIKHDRVIDANFIPKASLVQRSGNIIGVLTSGIQPGVSMVGAMDVVVVSIGLKDGVEVGDVFNIYKKGIIEKDPLYASQHVKLPDELNGNLMIFRPFNRVSYALIMDTQASLRVGDIIKSPFNGE